MTESLPRYLMRKKKIKDRSRIARYRCENEWKRSQHWREEEDGACRICGKEEEHLEHILRKATKSEI